MSEKRMQPHGGCEPAVRVTVRTRMMLREAASLETRSTVNIYSCCL